MRKAKKFLSLLLALSMVVSMVCTSALAAEEEEENGSNPVAEVDGKNYDTLTAAFKAVATANNKTIKLLRDVDYTTENSDTSAVDVSGVTIDLNGKTVTTGYTSSDDPLLILLGDFTLKNGKVQAKGSYGIFTGSVPGAVDSSKVAKIEDVEVLNGGVNAGSKVELTNVTAVGNTYYAVWSEGDVTIKSGTYSSKGYAVLGISSQYGSITVEGGKFTAEEATPMVLANGYGTPVIKGGMFNKDMSTENVTLDEGLQWKSENSTWTVEKKPVPVEKDVKIMGYGGEALGSYETLQDAINNYSSFEDVWMIVYDKPLTESVTVKNGQNVTISLEHTLTNEADKDTITVENGGWLTLYFNSDDPEYVVELVNNSEGHAAVNNAGTVDFPYNARVKGEYALKNNAGTVRLQGRFDGKIETAKPADNAETIDIGNMSVPQGAVMAGNGAMVNDPDENIIIKQAGDQWCITSEEGWYKCTQPYAEMNGQNYASIQDAVSAAGNTPAEIKVVYPYSSVSSVAITVAEGQNITLDLNGKTLNSKYNSWGPVSTEPVIVNNGTLTIKGKGTVKPGNTSGKFTANTVENTGALTIEGGTYQAYTGYKSLINGGGTITVKGGTFAEDISSIATPGEGMQFTGDGKGVEEKPLDETTAAAKIVNGEETTYYTTLQAAIDAAKPGDTVTLLTDTEESKTIVVKKSITIEGGNHKVNSTATRIFWVNASDVTVTLNDIEFVSNAAERGVQVNPDLTGVTLNINNCVIPGTYYAVNICGNTSVTLNINQSTISGWGALNLWGNTYEVTVTNSTLNGYNDKGYNSAGWNGFGVVVLEGDTTGKTEEHVEGCHVVLENCKINASTKVNEDGTANIQKAILFNSKSKNNVVEIKGGNTVVSYEQGELTPFCVNNGDGNKIAVSGGTFSTPVENQYCAEGYLPKDNGDGTYTVVRRITITGVTLNRTTASLYSNTTPNTVTLTATVAPADTTDSRTVTWSSSDTAVATVSNGVVTAVGPGTATITATAGGKTATCTVTVTRYTSSGSGGSYRPSRPSGGGGNSGGGDVEIDDPNVPLAQLPLPFTDVKDDDWFREAVAYAYSNSLIVGITPVTFEPDTQCDRAMVATILHRIEKTPEITFAGAFADVAEGQWYSNGVEWCAGNSIVSGYGDSLFGPQDKVTREQLASMLYRYAQYKGYDVSAKGDLSRYPDCGVVSDWAEEALSWAVGNGIVSGSDGLLQPGNHATRAQFASILQRFDEKFSK